MANPKTLIPQAHKLTPEERSRGGKNSVKAKRERKPIRNLLLDFLDRGAKDSKYASKMAVSMGLDPNSESICNVVTIYCLLKELEKNPSLTTLEKLRELIGEDDIGERNNGILDELTAYLKGGTDVKP